jgi:mannose-1-phosphate guanylyltransferase
MSVGVVVLCAGLGTRLRPLTERLPKPALPVIDAPLIRRHFQLAKSIGADDLAINTHHLPDAMRSCAEKEAAAIGLPLRVSHEAQIQGTGGGIRDAMAGRGHELVVALNGDTLFDVDLSAVLKAHRTSGAEATLVLAPLPRGEKYAAVEADRVMRIKRIAGSGSKERGLTPWHFTGVHVLGLAFFTYVAPKGPVDINRDVYPEMIDRGLVVAGVVERGYWSDVGTPERFLALHRDFLSGKVPENCAAKARPAVHPDARIAAGARVVGRCFVGRGAQIGEGATIGPFAFIGSGSAIGRGARVRRSVVISGTRVLENETIDGAIAMETLRVSGTLKSGGSARARK